MSDSNIRIGEVGYTFRKEFDAGWFTGTVREIRKGAGEFGAMFIYTLIVLSLHCADIDILI